MLTRFWLTAKTWKGNLSSQRGTNAGQLFIYHDFEGEESPIDSH